MTTPGGDINFNRCPDTGFPYLDLDDHSNEEVVILVQAARHNFEGYTRQEVEHAIKARKLQARKGHMSKAEMKAEVSRTPNLRRIFKRAQISMSDM